MTTHVDLIHASGNAGTGTYRVTVTELVIAGHGPVAGRYVASVDWHAPEYDTWANLARDSSGNGYAYTMGTVPELLARAGIDPARAEVITCGWFPLCDHDATAMQPHPVLGPVPICDRCADKLARL